MASGYILALSLFFTLQLSCFEAAIHSYRHATFAAIGNAFVLHGGSEGLYASPSSSSSSSSMDTTNDDTSSVRLENITFRRPPASAASMIGEADNVMVQALIFTVEDRESIGGSAYGGQRAVCCTPDLAKLGMCVQGTIIYRPSSMDPDWPKVFAVSFKGGDLVATLPSRTFQIPRTGMYNLYFIHCDPRLNGMDVDGKTIWKNPSGYLPGRIAPLMNFYGLMSIAYFLLGAFWLSQYSRFWKEVLPLQNCITLVIALGAIETSLWYLEFSGFNRNGIRPNGATISVVTFATIKRTVSRVLVLVVSMGYGVVRPTLGGLTSNVVMLGSTFFLSSEVLELVENVGAISDLSGKARLFLVLPVALLDAFFVIWMFTSLSSTFDKLQARRLTAKLEVYRKFTNALVVASVVSVAWICYELYFKSTDVYNERWQSAWIVPAFWHVLSFSLLCVICSLWAPSQNSTRYAYNNGVGEDFEEEESMLPVKEAIQHSNNNCTSSSDSNSAEKNDVSALELEEDKRE